jgi:hypothetical protein
VECCKVEKERKQENFKHERVGGVWVEINSGVTWKGKGCLMLFETVLIE